MSFFDVKGTQNKMPFGKKQVRGFIITLVIFLICMVIPMEGVGANGNLILLCPSRVLALWEWKPLLSIP